MVKRKYFEFISYFADCLNQYLAFKQATGRSVNAARSSWLHRFDHYLHEHNSTKLDQETVEGFVKNTLDTHSYKSRSWFSYIRDFTRWHQINVDPSTYVLSSDWKAGFDYAQTYKLSRSEVNQFFTAVDQAPLTETWHMQAKGFFGLMAACGMRVREVRDLLVEDVDFERQVVTIRQSKAEKSRVIPIGEELTAILFATNKALTIRFPGRGYFFVSAQGTHVKADSYNNAFHRIWHAAGLSVPEKPPYPRSYCFRHWFATTNIECWGKQENRVLNMLPYLAAYMGHGSLDSTLYYIHISPDFIGSWNKQYADNADSVIPKVEEPLW